MGEAFLSFSNFTYLHILAINSNERSFLNASNFTYLHILTTNSSNIALYILLSFMFIYLNLIKIEYWL
ncbi:hypothetical protein EWZ64_04485 [Helicobacter pylori]|nr:hypothetical protein [Helicobacter pylori]